jgi:hypothetical protein
MRLRYMAGAALALAIVALPAGAQSAAEAPPAANQHSPKRLNSRRGLRLSFSRAGRPTQGRRGTGRPLRQAVPEE